MVVSSRGGALPTRKNRVAATTEAGAAKSSEVSKQQKEEGLTVDDMESRQYSQSGSRGGGGASGGEARMGANDTTKQQSFVMDDIPTIDTSSIPPAFNDRSNRGRGASPSIITSRRGRSRSPVGYTTPSAAASSSRPNSRNGSSGRPLSRNDISSAAFAAGEAAAGVMDPYARQQQYQNHPQLVHGRARSPSPVNRFPTSALSFEVSPQQSLSFVGDGHSFDWTSGADRGDYHQNHQQHHHQHHQRYGSPQQQHHHSQYHPSRSSSPMQSSRAASRNSQALFPEHQILSASRSREYFGTQGGVGRVVSTTVGGNGSSGGNRERRTIRSPSPPKMAHRSSVFRGSPSPDNAANRLPAELMLALDDTPPSSPVISKPKKKRPTSNNHTSTIIDKELSATQDVAFENIQFDGIMPDGDYLANLSFRRSYELEQVFSFMNENKDDKNNRHDPMKLGTSSFANFANQLMCNSNEVDINKNIASQNSNMGDLTPINSFNDVQVDADELGRFLSSSVQQDSAGQYWSHQSSAPPPGGMNTQTPPSYNNVHNEGGGMNGGPPPPSGPGPSIPSLENSLATTTQVKVSTRHTLHPMVNLSSRSDFFVLLRKMAPAFMGFRFTLPEMSEPAPEVKDGPVVGKWNRPTENQMMICRRRVNSSVCAFGGFIANRAVSFDTMSEDVKEELEEKRKYDENLSMRYYMKENCVSWDVELHEVVKPSAKKAKIEAPDTPKASALKSPYCAPVTPKSPGSPGGDDGSKDEKKKGTKTKYRCKLCGLPKQNHTCTYKQKVVRSIGTQVYPVVNAFVSNEPGLLAPALSEMNNFTSLLSQDTSTAPSHHPVYRAPYASAYNGPVTPESHWSPNTPGGLSTMSSSDPGTPGTPHSTYSSSRNNFRKREFALMSRTMTHASTPGGYSARSKPDDAMFRDTMEIKREQFRTVRTSVAEKVAQPYQYPLVPTPYDQRKEMGDTLFALSKEVPALADSCASILREAREKDEWDQAVAELTTQVLVVLKCEEDDYTLEGLMRHLNGLGIAC